MCPNRDFPIPLLRHHHLAGNRVAIDSIAWEHSLLPTMSLWYRDLLVATVAFIDRQNPRLGVVLPLPPYAVIRATLQTLGDRLWSTGFASDPIASDLQLAADRVASDLRLTYGNPKRAAPASRIDPFDTSHDTVACPFLLAEFRLSAAGSFASVAAPQGHGRDHALP